MCYVFLLISFNNGSLNCYLTIWNPYLVYFVMYWELNMYWLL